MTIPSIRTVMAMLLTSLSLVLSGCEDPEVSAVRSAYEMSEAAIAAKNWEGLYQSYCAAGQKQLSEVIRLAKTATRDQTRALPPGVLHEVLQLRAGCEPARLKTLDTRGYFGWCLDAGLMFVDAERGITEKSIKVTGDRAVMTTQDEDYVYEVEYIKENGSWKQAAWSDPADDRDLQRLAREFGDNWLDGMLNLVLDGLELEKPKCADPWSPPA